MNATEYDYIFLGAGCASLSILMRMIESGKFSEKRILLIDKESKVGNDRTWCFWEKQAGFFEDIVYRKWEHLQFKTPDHTIDLDINPYVYKMIRGIDFHDYCLSFIKSRKNIQTVFGRISFDTHNITSINIDNQPLEVKKDAIVFNSVHEKSQRKKGKFYLLQHFKGWIIETPGEEFDVDTAILMDFSVSQNRGTSFVYLMPLSPTKALVEYTLFTETILSSCTYDEELENYIRTFLKLKHYTIVEEEFGIIPMTNSISPRNENGLYHIGTAGGQTKASTGYTFRFIQKQADSILEQLTGGEKPLTLNKFHRRFDFYDSTLLHILSKNLLDGKTIFSTLFKKNKAADVLKFLDNETSLSEEIRLLNSLPKKAFLQAGFKEFIKMLS